MKKIILLFVIAVLGFVTYQEANALTIDAVPQQPSFGPNDWIKIDLTVHGYNGGPIKWVAHRPDNTVASGLITQISAEKARQEIIRDAFDNRFGNWTINYQYGGVNKTITFMVNPIDLVVFTDKELYYEPDRMKINITSSYYVPNAKLAQFYYLNFYDKKGNPAKDVSEIGIRAIDHSTVYSFWVRDLAKYNPPGLYKLKIQYFNMTKEIPFLLGDIRKLMEITVSNSAQFNQGEDVTLDMIFTRVKESSGTLKITDPLGNTTSREFSVNSVHTSLVLGGITNEVGTYNFVVQYAGITKNGFFKVVSSKNQLPNITVDIFPNKLNYNKGEIVETKVHVSDAVSNSIRSWVTDPNGIEHAHIFIPFLANDTIVPHKINKQDMLGPWNFYVDYGGIIKSSTFYVGGSVLEQKDWINSSQFDVPVFLSSINSTFSSPRGIAVDSENNIYVADWGNSGVKEFDLSGNTINSWGEYGTQDGQFRHPSGIYVNEKYVYVADTGNARIQMFDKSGNFVSSWGSYGEGHGMFHTPVSLDADRSGDIFVADSGRNVIQVFDKYGTYKDEIQTVLTSVENFAGIKAIKFDSNDNFYAISVDGKILKYSNIGKFINSYGSNGTEEGRFSDPSAVAVDSNDYFYVADTGNHRIQKFDPYGNFLISWNSSGSGSYQFQEPAGLAVDFSDNIFVVDKKNNSVQKFALHKNADKSVIPSWVKNYANWWSQGGLDQTNFVLATNYMVNQGLIHAPSVTGHDSVADREPPRIPEWMKRNVMLWTSDQIDDKTFTTAIEYLLSIGVMRI